MTQNNTAVMQEPSTSAVIAELKEYWGYLAAAGAGVFAFFTALVKLRAWSRVKRFYRGPKRSWPCRRPS